MLFRQITDEHGYDEEKDDAKDDLPGDTLLWGHRYISHPKIWLRKGGRCFSRASRRTALLPRLLPKFRGPVLLVDTASVACYGFGTV